MNRMDKKKKKKKWKKWIVCNTGCVHLRIKKNEQKCEHTQQNTRQLRQPNNPFPRGSIIYIYLYIRPSFTTNKCCVNHALICAMCTDTQTAVFGNKKKHENHV